MCQGFSIFFLGFLHHFVLTSLATSSIRVYLKDVILSIQITSLRKLIYDNMYFKLVLRPIMVKSTVLVMFIPDLWRTQEKSR